MPGDLHEPAFESAREYALECAQEVRLGAINSSILRTRLDEKLIGPSDVVEHCRRLYSLHFDGTERLSPEVFEAIGLAIAGVGVIHAYTFERRLTITSHELAWDMLGSYVSVLDISKFHDQEPEELDARRLLEKLKSPPAVDFDLCGRIWLEWQIVTAKSAKGLVPRAENRKYFCDPTVPVEIMKVVEILNSDARVSQREAAKRPQNLPLNPGHHWRSSSGTTGTKRRVSDRFDFPRAEISRGHA